MKTVKLGFRSFASYFWTQEHNLCVPTHTEQFRNTLLLIIGSIKSPHASFCLYWYSQINRPIPAFRAKDPPANTSIVSATDITSRPLAERLMQTARKTGNTSGVSKSSSDWFNYTGLVSFMPCLSETRRLLTYMHYISDRGTTLLWTQTKVSLNIAVKNTCYRANA